MEVTARLSSGRAAELDQRAAGSDIDLGCVAGLYGPGTVQVISGRGALFARLGVLGPRGSAWWSARIARCRGAPEFDGAVVGGQDGGEAAQQRESADWQPVQAQPEQVVGLVKVVDEFPARPGYR